MGRTAHHWHGMRHCHPANQPEGWTPDQSARVTTWCNDVTYMSLKERERPQREVDCPKCAAAIGKAHLASRYAGRVELKRPADLDEVGSPWRSTYGKVWKGAYEFHLDGVHRGYIVVDNGWGTAWELRSLNPYGDSEEKPWGYIVSSSPRKWNPDSGGIFARVHSAARDAMACAAVKAVEAGLLPTRAEYEAQRLANKEREAKEEVERAALRVERDARLAREEGIRQERLEAWRLALCELEARPDLTNLERAGLEAIKLLFRS